MTQEEIKKLMDDMNFPVFNEWGYELMLKFYHAAQRQAYERAAEVCVSKEIPFDIEDWINWTKRDVSSETALALATAIRALIEGDGK